MTCSVVVARNGLHSHCDSHYNHHKQHLYSVQDAECPDRKISTIRQQTVIDKNHDTTCTYIHDKRRHTDSEYIHDDVLFQLEAGTFEANIAFLIVEMIEHPYHTNEL